MDKVPGYSPAQIALHWTVVVLVAFQFLAHDAIATAWQSFLSDEAAPARGTALTYMHVAAGTLVLVLALARIYLRATRGAPPPPEDEPRLMQLSAELIHGLIYALLLLLPVTGMAAWFLGVGPAGTLHGWMTNVLLGAIALHIAGALFQHFVRRSEVLIRMFRPQRSER